MIIGITGSRDDVTPEQLSRIEAFFQREHLNITEVHHGDCKGVDEYVHNLVQKYSNITVYVHPPLKNKHRAHCVCDNIYDPLDYIERNHSIVDECDLLIAVPKSRDEEVQSGTWSTIRYAIKQEKKIKYIYPSHNKDSGQLLTPILDTVKRKRNIILHGPGGVGKSWLFRRIIQALRKDERIVYATAMTGVAAVNLNDPVLDVTATTLHRFAGVKKAEKDIPGLVSLVKSQKNVMKRITLCDILIIDEVSMLGSSLFYKISEVFKVIRENENVFGGIQLIVGGDFLQLPPVKDNWVFGHEQWTELNFRPFILETSYRYSDRVFFELLLRVRMGRHTSEDVKLLSKRVKAKRKMNKILQEIQEINPKEVIRPTMFFPKRAQAEAYNQDELDKLKTELVVHYSHDSIISKKGHHDLNDYRFLLEENIPEIIALKVGAQVMLKVNVDTEMGLCNGSRGVITEIVRDEAVIVKFINGVHTRIERHNFTFENKEITVTRLQIPVVLAYAMTIHKSQSVTLDYIVVDLGPDIFLDGQAYVALSRCSELKGLFISELHPHKITANPDAVKYADYLNEKYEEEYDT